MKFNTNETGNLIHIMDTVGSGKYYPSAYRDFYVYDPKKRLVQALPYCDRIVHQWYVEEFIKPYFIPRFIDDSYACIPKRGSHKAVAKLQQWMRVMRKIYGYYYILKMDISKFFPNVNIDILYNDILAPRIADPKLLKLTRTIIYDDGVISGLPIGNYVSQYLANIYLNELDQYCKHELKIRNYVRYMDDFIMLAPNRGVAREWYDEIDNFVNTRLKLRLNPKSRYMPNDKGVEFVGYRIHEDFMLIRKRSKRSITQIIEDYIGGADDEMKFVERATAWHGHAMHADAYRYTEKMLGEYRNILPAVFV